MMTQAKWYGQQNSPIEVGRSRMHWKADSVYVEGDEGAKPTIAHHDSRTDPNLKVGCYLP